VDFIDKLKNEYLDEVFTWLCLGAKKWYCHKHLDPPKSVQSATNEYINDLDIISKFIGEICEVNSKFTVKWSDLFNEFKYFCSENAIFMRKKDFLNRMENKGYVTKREADGIFYKGLKLESESENLLDDK